VRNFLTLLILFFTLALLGQRRPNAEPEWTATWITLGDADTEAAGMYLFRKSFNLDAAPTEFPIRISADNRYKLFVNGTLVSVGPNWGDIKHWNYQILDIASHLKQGVNTFAVKVWNEAELRAVAQFSFKTALIVQGQNELAKVVDTDKSWKVTEDKSYTPLEQHIRGYYAAGAGDFIDMNKTVTHWKAIDFDDSSWSLADTVFEAVQQGFGFRQQEGWNLVPSILPEMELTKERLATERKSEGVKVPSSFPEKPTDIKVDAKSHIKILLDQDHLTNAYLTLLFSGGKNSVITLQYAEGLYDNEGAKDNRDIIEGKTMTGRRDSIISNGMDNQEYTSLTYRTYRYVELDVKTKEEPLVSDRFEFSRLNISGMKTLYHKAISRGTPIIVGGLSLKSSRSVTMLKHCFRGECIIMDNW
jgi:hypothetical protein